MAVGTIYWSYDDITYTLNISGNPLPATSMNGSYDINVDTSEGVDVENVKHFMHDGAYVDFGGEYFIPWGSVVGDIQSVNITDLSPLYMGEWFDGGENITAWNLSNVDFSECISFSYTFQKCKTLPQISDIVVSSNATTLRGMFYQCANTTSLDLSHWDVSNVTDIFNLFCNNTNLSNLNVANWNVSKVQNMARVFSSCEKLTSLDISNWNTSSAKDMSYMFHQMFTLNTLDVSDWDVSNVEDMQYMFYRCELLSSINVSNWNVGNVTNMHGMFNGANSFATIDVSNWDVSNVTDMGYIFSTYYDEGGMEKALASIDVSNWDVSNVVDMSFMFNRCKLLTTIDVGNWDVSNVVNMEKMFRLCRGVTTLDIGNWDVSNVTNMNQMFNGTLNLTSLDVSNWNTSKVTDMGYMFGGFYIPKATTQPPLDYLDVSNWNTSQVTTMKAMFQGRINLTSIDVSNWNVSKVTDISLMFDGISSNTSFGMKLEELHLEKWKTNNVVNTEKMFYNCPSLTKIYVGRSDLDMSNVTTSTDMFYNCMALSGAIPYDSTKTNVEYANYTNGYFTALVAPQDFMRFTIKEDMLYATSFNYWRALTYANNMFVAVGDGMTAYSYDGVNWVENKILSLSHPTSVTYGFGKFYTLSYQTGLVTENPQIWSSSDGISWSKVYTLPFSAYGGSIVFGGDKLVVVCGETNKALYSTNGTTWTQTTLPVNTTWDTVVYANGVFVASATDRDTTPYTFNIAYSTNGTTWTKVTTLHPAGVWYKLNCVNNIFMVEDRPTGEYTSSTDGVTWSLITPYPKPTAYGIGIYLGESSNTETISCSADKNTWYTTNIKELGWIGQEFGNGKFVLLKSNGTVAYTTDSAFAVYIKGSTQWKEGELRIKSNNNWIEPNKLFIKQNNTWTEI